MGGDEAGSNQRADCPAESYLSLFYGFSVLPPLQNRREPLRQGQRRSRGEKERPHPWCGQVQGGNAHMGGEQLAPLLLRRNTPPLTPPSVFPLCHSARQVRTRDRALEVGTEQNDSQASCGGALSRIGLRQP